MADTELAVILSLKDEMTAKLRSVNNEIEAATKSWKDNFGAIKGQLTQATVAMTAFGAAVFGALGYAYKVYEEDRLSVARLTNQLKNLGVAYDSVSASLEAQMEATRKATGISENEQIDAISRLILITGDYRTAVKYLSLTLDFAKLENMDTTSAAQIMGRVIEGDINVLHRYLGAMDGAATSAQALAWMQTNVSGSAEAMRSPLDALNTAWTNLNAVIGGSTGFGELLDSITGIVDGITDWVEKNPALVEQLTNLTVALGGGAAGGGVIGGIVLAIAALVALAGGPVTLIILAIVAVIAYIIFLALNWEYVVAYFKSGWQMILMFFGMGLAVIQTWWDLTWNNLKLSALNIVNGILSFVEVFVRQFLIGIDKVAEGINAFGKLIGQDWNLGVNTDFNINKIKPEDWGIKTNEELAADALERLWAPIDNFRTSPEFEEAWDLFGPIFEDIKNFFSGTATPSTEEITNPLETPVMPTPGTFGNYGNVGTTSVYQFGDITITVDGSKSANEIAEEIREALLKIQSQNGTTGIK